MRPKKSEKTTKVEQDYYIKTRENEVWRERQKSDSDMVRPEPHGRDDMDAAHRRLEEAQLQDPNSKESRQAANALNKMVRENTHHRVVEEKAHRSSAETNPPHSREDMDKAFNRLEKSKAMDEAKGKGMPNVEAKDGSSFQMHDDDMPVVYGSSRQRRSGGGRGSEGAKRPKVNINLM